MSTPLTDLQKQLCNRLQRGLPLCPQPFAEIAKDLDSSEAEVLQQTNELKAAGIIRRLASVVNQRSPYRSAHSWSIRTNSISCWNHPLR